MAQGQWRLRGESESPMLMRRTAKARRAHCWLLNTGDRNPSGLREAKDKEKEI